MRWRHVVPVMRKQGGGLFLLTGSISSVCGMEVQGVYGPSKGAVIQIARTMAVDYARDNIRVNAVCPGVVETPLLRRTAVESGNPEKFLGDLAAASPIGRNAQPEEIARFFQFLASDHARFFTGSVLMRAPAATQPVEPGRGKSGQEPDQLRPAATPEMSRRAFPARHNLVIGPLELDPRFPRQAATAPSVPPLSGSRLFGLQAQGSHQETRSYLYITMITVLSFI